MAEQALPSVERLDELEKWCRNPQDVFGKVGDEDGRATLDPDPDILALISAARLVPVLMAERDAWRDWDKDDNPTMGELERRLDRIRKAHAATDAALARAGGKE